jgi:hypothetical protein
LDLWQKKRRNVAAERENWQHIYRVITKEMTEIKHALLSHGVT